jgi:hypothetical protein
MSKQLDWLAEEVLATFAELDFDLRYIEDVQHTLMGKDRFAILIWCHNLGSKCREALAERLGINADDFDTTIKTVCKL